MRRGQRLYLHHAEPETEALGPGRRYALWLQGCRRRCPGCLNPLGWAEDSGGYWREAADLAGEIAARPGLTGVTISGGEPFLQAEALAELVGRLREISDLDLIAYSGFTLEELKSQKAAAVDYILDNIDILIDGEYLEGLNHNAYLRGSDNQRFHFLSPKYRPWAGDFYRAAARPLEFVVREAGEVFAIGLPEKGFEAAFRKAAERLQKARGKKP